MKYIWINPVTDSMYDADLLNAFLRKHGYQRVEASVHWLNIVKEKYKTAAAMAEKVVIDMRCPKIKGLLQEYELASEVVIPDIEPILIHCGREIGEREELRGREKLITTPCQALADMGNLLKLPETIFLPWNQFLLVAGEEPAASVLRESPIPPGFFTEFEGKIISVTGEEGIRKLFQNHTLDDVKLAELLFCQNGCHNGDGVRIGESR